ncbi:MAG: hypothetical protein MHM6MM_009585 [Cercozoa sp. M6MM]
MEQRTPQPTPTPTPEATCTSDPLLELDAGLVPGPCGDSTVHLDEQCETIAAMPHNAGVIQPMCNAGTCRRMPNRFLSLTREAKVQQFSFEQFFLGPVPLPGVQDISSHQFVEPVPDPFDVVDEHTCDVEPETSPGTVLSYRTVSRNRTCEQPREATRRRDVPTAPPGTASTTVSWRSCPSACGDLSVRGVLALDT